MIKHVDECDRYVEINGFQNVQIENLPKFLSELHKRLPNNVEVQLLDANLVATWRHLYFAVLNALLAYKNGRKISKSLAVETALYASTQRQIQKALATVGVNSTTRNIATILISEKADAVKAGLLIVAKQLNAQPDESVLELSKEKVQRIRNAFNISNAELDAMSAASNSEQAIVDLIIERVALLSTQL